MLAPHSHAPFAAQERNPAYIQGSKAARTTPQLTASAAAKHGSRTSGLQAACQWRRVSILAASPASSWLPAHNEDTEALAPYWTRRCLGPQRRMAKIQCSGNDTVKLPHQPTVNRRAAWVQERSKLPSGLSRGYWGLLSHAGAPNRP